MLMKGYCIHQYIKWISRMKDERAMEPNMETSLTVTVLPDNSNGQEAMKDSLKESVIDLRCFILLTRRWILFHSLKPQISSIKWWQFSKKRCVYRCISGATSPTVIFVLKPIIDIIKYFTVHFLFILTFTFSLLIKKNKFSTHF